MASSIYADLGEGTPQRTIIALLESASDGTATITTDASRPVFGKAFSYEVRPFTDSYQPSNNFSVTMLDDGSPAKSVVRAPAGLSSAVSNSAVTEGTVLDANSLTAPYIIGGRRITFAASGMGSGKKAYVILNVLR